MFNVFNVGDFIKTENGHIGIVGWVENKCMNIKADDGYVGINLKTGTKGFLAPVKVDECTESSLDELLEILEKEKEEVETRLHKYQFNQNAYEKLCEKNELLEQLLSIYINA